jgi:hypothetical protein
MFDLLIFVTKAQSLVTKVFSKTLLKSDSINELIIGFCKFKKVAIPIFNFHHYFHSIGHFF